MTAINTSAEDAGFGPETIIALANGRAMHCPAHPNACEYVRIVQDGKEIAYWDQAEWRDDPAIVMGAIMGAAQGGHVDPDLDEDPGEEEDDFIVPDTTDEEASLTNNQLEEAERRTGQRTRD